MSEGSVASMLGCTVGWTGFCRASEALIIPEEVA